MRFPSFFFVAFLAAAVSPVLADDLWRPEELVLKQKVNRNGKVVKNKSADMSVGATALKSDTVTTEATKAWVLFNKRNPYAVMMPETSLTLGTNCVELDKGRTLIVGKTCIAIVDSTADALSFISTFSSVIIERDQPDQYIVKTLAGQALVDKQPLPLEGEFGLLNQYPRVETTFGVGVNGLGSAYPAGAGMAVGSVSTFVPLAQSRQRSILYSYTAAGSNFDGYWGASTELGYRWFTPSNQLTSSLFVGYSGFDSPGCFSNYVNLGGQLERSRWRLGATAGINPGGCEAGFNYGSLNLAIPIAKIGPRQSALLNLTPYVLWGNNIITPFDFTEGASSDQVAFSPGARVSLSFPFSESIRLEAYGGIDSVYGAIVGGRLNLRLSPGGSIVKDPNLPDRSPESPNGSPDQPPKALGTGTFVNESYKATFNSKGELIGSVEKMSAKEMASVITEYLRGIEPLPENNRIADVAARNGALQTSVAGILGIDFLEASSVPISQSAQQPFDVTLFPTAGHACASSGEAKDYAEQQLRDDGNTELADQVAAADVIYLGQGDKVSQGWPITTSKANAYRLANSSTCDQINSVIRSYNSYGGPSNPLQNVTLD
jgi:hypothetical protein